jgi:ABC-type transport system involved in cytochrome c biogenesis permease subunit
MTDPLTTIGLIVAFIVAVIATVDGYRRVGRTDDDSQSILLRFGMLAILLICSILLGYRSFVVEGWAPLASHVDGLLLLSALLAAAIAYLVWLERLPGVGLFATPVLAVLLLWGVCAVTWTFRPFEIGSVWNTIHLICVYVVAIDLTTAAAAGALWLTVDRHMRRKDHAVERFRLLRKLGNLEAIERVIIRQATIGLLLLTMALISGVVLVVEGDSKLGEGWWYSPKVILAAGVWLIYALVMHVRFVPTFRGRRAAILAIVGFVLMLATLGIAQALPALPREASPANVDSPTVGGQR